MRKVFVFALMFVLAFAGSSPAAMIIGTTESVSALNVSRVIPSDPKLPKYDNPTEIDLEDGNLHISFLGAFRHIDKNKKPDKYVVFCFSATPQKDMGLNVGQSELFDGKAKRYNRGGWTPDIGDENTYSREIIEHIPTQVRFGYDMPASRAEMLPTIARVSFTFNGQTYQFRNIKTEEWSVWEGLQQELGL